jgi:hypothetical protein
MWTVKKFIGYLSSQLFTTVLTAETEKHDNRMHRVSYGWTSKKRLLMPGFTRDEVDYPHGGVTACIL